MPLHAFNLIKDFTKWLDEWPSAIWVFYSAHWLAMANCTINPFIYGYSNKSFRVNSDFLQRFSMIRVLKCLLFLFNFLLNRREWKRQSERTSKSSTIIFRRIPKSVKHGFYSNNINNNSTMAVNVNTHFLKQNQTKS